MADEKEKDQDLEQFLQTTVYTIPVELSKPDSLGKLIKRRITIQYEFDDGIAKAIKDGRQVEFENPDGTKRMERESIPINEQLCMIVKQVNGIDTTPTEEWWGKTFFRFRQQMLEAVMNDVYPNAKRSGA